MEGNVEYLLYPTSYKQLAGEIKTLVDEYQSKKISEEQLKEVLLGWRHSVPEMMFEREDFSRLNKSLLRYIGKTREKVVLLALTR